VVISLVVLSLVKPYERRAVLTSMCWWLPLMMMGAPLGADVHPFLVVDAATSDDTAPRGGADPCERLKRKGDAPLPFTGARPTIRRE
jgi:hypothetical protein